MQSNNIKYKTIKLDNGHALFLKYLKDENINHRIDILLRMKRLECLKKQIKWKLEIEMKSTLKN